jgi:hypothetical protein
MYDFALMRAARHLVVSVSTFSWLAAWLSHAETITIPLTGFYNPAQRPDVNLLPLDDPRYRFYLFPVNHAVPVADHVPVHAALNGRWRPISAVEIRAIRQRWPVVAVDRHAFDAAFDEAAYLEMYPDISAAVADANLRSGQEHYQLHGFFEGRRPCHFDQVDYGMRNPEAAMLVALGYYANLLHHFIMANPDRASGSADKPGIAPT